MQLTSPAFSEGAEIPQRYARQGANLSPPLIWTGVPAGARSLALIVDDPDAPDPAAPKRTWVHWVVVDLPPDSDGLKEGIAGLPAGRVGLNDWKHEAWDGPAPPIGRHRYVFKLYALDRAVDVEHPTKRDVEAAIKGHVLAKATLVGTYASDAGRA